MRRIIKTFLCVAMLAMGWQQAHGFVPIGPLPGAAGLPGSFGDKWQVAAIGYAQPYINSLIPGSPVWLGDIGGPRNLGEGYRRNAPVIYYAYDRNFTNFFGAQGETYVDQAFAIMNGVFTNHANGVDGYSANLGEFPFNTQHFNGMAQGLYLTDLKSVTLHLLVEQMGLAEPERYTWALHNRAVGLSPPPCPMNISYLVIQRNLGFENQPLTGPQTGTLYSPYVNNILYTYNILEDCGRGGFTFTATTVPFPTDLSQPGYTAVAANDFEGFAVSGLGGLSVGGFYTGLTEDDVAGLRYLMSSNNIQFEIPAAGSQFEYTNYGTLNLLQTSDLASLLQFAQTNPPAALAAAFPNLTAELQANYFTFVTNPVVTAFLTNFPGSPVGTPPTLVLKTNGVQISAVTNYVYAFDNVIIVHQHSNTVAQLQTTTVGVPTGSPVGTPATTNVTNKKIILTNVVSGDYYIIPPGSCGFAFAANPIQNNLAGRTTNVIAAATNTLTGAVSSESIVTSFTNNWFTYYLCTFQPPTPADYQGVQGVQFVRVSDNNVDPATGTFYIPLTNSYSMVWWNPTNGTIGKRFFQRIVTAPDILLTSSDQATGPAGNGFNGTVTRNINFETGQILPNLSGPGVIDRETTFDYNRVGTIFFNGPFADTNSLLFPIGEVNQTTATPDLLWGSFDGTTNTPVVYPSALDLQGLVSAMVVTVSPSSLPDGTNGVAYPTTTFTATGAQPQLTWSLLPSSNLPSGLVFFGNTLAGTPNGNPPGVYDIAVQLTDSSVPPKVVTMSYTITIH